LNKIDFRGWDKDILVLDKFCYAGKEDSIFPGNLKIRINKFMDLALLTNIPDNFFPEVGWSLYLNNLHFPKLKRLPESGIISVSGDLSLDSVNNLNSSIKLDVGRDLLLRRIKDIHDNRNINIKGKILLKDYFIKE